MKSILNNKGYTITEVLIALVIFSIISLSLFFILTFALKTDSQNQLQLFAAKFAEEKMLFIKHNKDNYIKKIRYDTIPSLKEKIDEEKISWDITVLKKIIYNRITDIKIENLSPSLLHVWVIIQWSEKGKEKKYTLESYL
ncbi:MAG: prepilin-type N-terminal cleavage/methylation domain-containing protein [Spirochaetes bacterium]|nr:prepilin-type N-terminal cleavage/methylation domain-containing protein [Spirochaetota bacterium]